VPFAFERRQAVARDRFHHSGYVLSTAWTTQVPGM
jgi:hypothetical protein